MANKNIDIKRQQVFEYLVLKHPTVAAFEKGAGSEIIVDLKTVCANDEAGARLKAIRAIPDEQIEHESRLEVVIRPF